MALLRQSGRCFRLRFLHSPIGVIVPPFVRPNGLSKSFWCTLKRVETSGRVFPHSKHLDLRDLFIIFEDLDQVDKVELSVSCLAGAKNVRMANTLSFCNPHHKTNLSVLAHFVWCTRGNIAWPSPSAFLYRETPAVLQFTPLNFQCWLAGLLGITDCSHLLTSGWGNGNEVAAHVLLSALIFMGVRNTAEHSSPELP